MDQLLSSIIPTNRIGQDGFVWWVGQIEGTASDEIKNKGGYRYKIRIIGDHPQSPEILPTEDLPWANVVMPVTVPFIPGNTGGGHPQLLPGCWVIGFYLDSDKQKPLILGSIGQTPGATKVINQYDPNNLPFTTAIISDVNVKSDGAPEQAGTSKNTATGGLSDGTKDGDGNSRVNTPQKKLEPLKGKKTSKSEEWCQTVAEKCDDPDMKSQMNVIMGEFLSSVQNNGGNIGTYAVNQVTGKLNEGIGIARKYVNKAMRVVREFVARVKGFIIEKLTNAVKNLINALLRPSESGNSLTPVTEWFNKLLKDLGCQMADLGDRLAAWLTNVLMSYVNQIYRAAACQIDKLVNGILSKINSLMEDILGKILGPLQDILGAIAGPLNIIGGAVNFILKLLGISCSGPDNECSKYKQTCTDGEEKKSDNDKDFLDNLLGSIDNLFPATGPDYTQYVCDEAYTGNPLIVTTVGFTGGIPRLPGPGTSSRKKIITYSITDVEVQEGKPAVFTVTRSGYIDSASSVTYKTLLNLGTASPKSDYLPVDDILGFAPKETSKTISVNTLFSDERENDEDFYVRLFVNSPSEGSNIDSKFTKNVGKCTIKERNIKEPSDPYSPRTVNPDDELDDTFPPDETDIENVVDEEVSDEDDTTVNVVKKTPTHRVSANRSSCPEGGFIVYTITTTNVDNGTILYYTLSGTNITSSDIIGSNLTGNVVVNSNTAKVTIGIEEDDVVEDAEILRFTINGTGAFADVVIVAATDIAIEDFDQGVGEKPENTYPEFKLPTVDPNKIITDENGGIIDIPIDIPGDPWSEPPYVFIGGEGIGAVATALLDREGYLTEIRIKSGGYGYKKNLPSDKNVRCIIDTFTLIRPGIGYSDVPNVYVNDELGIAEAIINEDGFVIGARVLNRQKTFNSFPTVIVVGGGGYGAKLIPSLSCLDNSALTTIGATKIGTGRYVDCP
jgi:hypothetical protein